MAKKKIDLTEVPVGAIAVGEEIKDVSKQ